jgi:hypothetical protein
MTTIFVRESIYHLAQLQKGNLKFKTKIASFDLGVQLISDCDCNFVRSSRVTNSSGNDGYFYLLMTRTFDLNDAGFKTVFLPYLLPFSLNTKSCFTETQEKLILRFACAKVLKNTAKNL